MAPTTKLESIKVCIYSDGRIVGVCVCVCRLVPVFRAGAKNLEIRVSVCVCVCVCVRRLVPVFRAGAKNAEIRVCVCVCLVQVRPGSQKYIILRCLRRPVCPKKAKLFIVAGAPPKEKSVFAPGPCVCSSVF